jgi:hypothetical protein
MAVAATPPTVNWAYSKQGDLGRIQVSASAEAGVAGFVAHVIAPDTGVELATVSDFNLVSGTEQDGLWEAGALVQLPALGSYRLDFEVTDRTGFTASQPQAGWLQYAVETSISGFTISKSLNYSNRVAQFAGTLMGRDPGTGTLSAVPNFPMQAWEAWGTSYTGEFRTDANGRFNASLTISGACCEQPNIVQVFANYDETRPFYLQSAFDSPVLNIKQAPTRLPVSVTRDRVNAGEQVTISGRYQFKADDVWHSVPNHYIAVMLCLDPDCVYGSYDYVYTDANGDFSITVVPHQTGFYRIATYNEDPFITTVTAKQFDMVVLQTADLTTFAAQRDTDGKVAIVGHILFGNFTPSPAPVEIQFSTTGNGDWATLATVDGSRGPSETGGYRFETTIDETRAGYWRAVYRGVPDAFQSDISDSVFVG